MPKGIALPFRANDSGGIKLVESDTQDRKIISSALRDGDNENPFNQDLCLGADPIFGLDNAQHRSAIVLRLKQIFDEFSAARRYRLVEDSITFRNSETESELKEGDTVLEFRYLNIESDEELPFEQPFKSGIAGQGV